MSAQPRPIRPVANRPPGRTVEVEVADGPFAGWSCTARASFSAQVAIDIDSGRIERVVDALERVIVTHNFPNDETGELAGSLAEVDYAGLAEIGRLIGEAIGRLPPR